MPTIHKRHPNVTNKPVFLGPKDLVMRNIQFIPEKENGSPNEGVVSIVLPDREGNLVEAKQVTGPLNWPAPEGESFTGRDFLLQITTAGDGLKVIYSTLMLAFLLFFSTGAKAQPYCEPNDAWCAILSQPPSVFTNSLGGNFIHTLNGLGTNTTIFDALIIRGGGANVILRSTGGEGGSINYLKVDGSPGYLFQYDEPDGDFNILNLHAGLPLVSLTINSDGDAAFGGTVAGATPTDPTHLTTKAYVDALSVAIGNFVYPANSGEQLFVNMPVTAASPATTLHAIAFGIDTNRVLQIRMQSDGAGNATNGLVYVNDGELNRRIIQDAAGTGYALTTTPSALDFGTTDPVITIDQAGTYLIRGTVTLSYEAATFTAGTNVTVKFRRTNNTAADLTGGTRTVPAIALTTFTGGAEVTLKEVEYTTGNSNDSLTIFGDISSAIGAGTLRVSQATIVATRMK